MDRDKRLQENLKENLAYAFPLSNKKTFNYRAIAFDLIEKTRKDEHEVAFATGVPKEVLEALLAKQILICDPQKNLCMPGPKWSLYYGVVDTQTLYSRLPDSSNKK